MRSLARVHFNNAWPYPTFFGGSPYVVMFVHSASRPQRPYGARERRAATILSAVKRFVVDMRVHPRFELTTARTNRRVCLWTSVMVSDYAASLTYAP